MQPAGPGHDFLAHLLPSPALAAMLLPLSSSLQGCAFRLGQEEQRDAVLIHPPPDPPSYLITAFRIPWQPARPF